MYGFELVAVLVGIGAATIFGIKWLYQNAFIHYESRTKIMMIVIGLAIILFMILANTILDDVI